MPRRPAALLALALAFAVAVVVGVAAPAAAQVPGLTATLSVPSSTSVGVPVQATAVFTPPAGSTTPVEVGIRLLGASTNATLAIVTSTTELTGCIVRMAGTQVRCAWTPGGGGPQTLTVTINPVAVSVFSVAATSELPGVPQVAIAGATSSFAITQQPVTTTTTTTTVATTTAPTGPTTPTSAGVAPTSAAATTAAPLPATGGSDANAVIAVTVLALGAFLLIVARKVREA